MARIARVKASLRLYGPDLEPSELTQRLGCEPTTHYRKGDRFLRDGRGIRPQGRWSISSSLPEHTSINEHVQHLLGRVSADPAIWNRLAIYRSDIFLGLFLDSDMEGDSLSPESARMLAERGVSLEFDIYSKCEDRPAIHDADGIAPPSPSSSA
jgi:hypothetical protein